MDLLRTAVVDVTTLVATCRALKAVAAEDGLELKRKLRQRLRRDMKRGTLAYIDTLARTRRGSVDDALLAQCRAAAEQQMPLALVHGDLLRRVMSDEAGSLGGMAATRQDLWRLAHVAIHLGSGLAHLLASGVCVDVEAAEAAGARLRRRFRKALIAYARTTLRTRAHRGKALAKARQAALAEIGPRGVADAECLAGVEAGAGSDRTVLRDGVARPLFDLMLDWETLDEKLSHPPVLLG